jgi:LemA protein
MPGINRILSIVAMGVFLASCGVNNVPKLDEEVNAAWSQVENQYQRRADLIPNLVETVKGYATQERETLTDIVEARSKIAQTPIPADIQTNREALDQFEKNQTALSGALSRLLVVVERYPDLKSNQNFLSLQSQLEGTENRISVARRDYIEAVQKYNTELRTIPGRWIAAILYPDAKVKENLRAPEGSSTPPRVNFGK